MESLQGIGNTSLDSPGKREKKKLLYLKIHVLVPATIPPKRSTTRETTCDHRVLLPNASLQQMTMGQVGGASIHFFQVNFNLFFTFSFTDNFSPLPQ